MADLAKQKAKKHDVLRITLKYKSHTPDVRYVDPGQEKLTFEHLSDVDYKIMLKKKLIAVAKVGK